MNLLYSYTNGNYSVELFDDGTKVRRFDDEPSPIHPESLDVKITNFCEPTENNPICSYCHEKSGLNGKHADLEKLFNVLSVLPAGVEIAIGGGNPLSHPGLIDFLNRLKNNGLIVNMTINQKHIGKYNNLISELINNKLIHGVGISYSKKEYLNDIKSILSLTTNMVFHLIMGINSTKDINDLYALCQSENKECKILVLGYKQYGFGLNYYLRNKEVEDNKKQWYMFLPKYFKYRDMVLSFDNLAISQMNLKRFFPDDVWNKFYMGDDGKYTMYIDSVKQEFAKSSTSDNRINFNNSSLLEFFSGLNNE